MLADFSVQKILCCAAAADELKILITYIKLLDFCHRSFEHM